MRLHRGWHLRELHAQAAGRNSRHKVYCHRGLSRWRRDRPGSGARALHCRALTIQAYHSREPYHTWRKTGFARILVQTGKTREPRLPDVPTLYELMNEHKTPEAERRLLPLVLAATDFGRPIIAPPASRQTKPRFSARLS